MSRYRKVTVAMWGDSKFRALSKPQPNGQTLWVNLITGPHTSSVPGLFSAGEAGLAESLDWPLRAFRKAFAEIAAQGMAQADWSARVVFLPNAIVHNFPEAPNVVRSWASYLSEIPECELKSTALGVLRAFMEAKGKAWGEAFAEASAKPLAKALANQEQEQEQERSGAGAGLTPPSPPSRNGFKGPSRHVDAWTERQSGEAET